MLSLHLREQKTHKPVIYNVVQRRCGTPASQDKSLAFRRSLARNCPDPACVRVCSRVSLVFRSIKSIEIDFLSGRDAAARLWQELASAVRRGCDRMRLHAVNSALHDRMIAGPRHGQTFQTRSHNAAPARGGNGDTDTIYSY